MATSAPARASSRAISRPMPLLPPVTSAVRPASGEGSIAGGTAWLLAHAPAAVDQQRRAGDEGGFVARQIEHRRGDLFRPAHAADGLRAGHLTVGGLGIRVFLQPRLDERRFDASRADAIHPDAV